MSMQPSEPLLMGKEAKSSRVTDQVFRISMVTFMAFVAIVVIFVL
jgi:hypothetical protein